LANHLIKSDNRTNVEDVVQNWSKVPSGAVFSADKNNLESGILEKKKKKKKAVAEIPTI
jgi:hypothetical protein